MTKITDQLYPRAFREVVSTYSPRMMVWTVFQPGGKIYPCWDVILSPERIWSYEPITEASLLTTHFQEIPRTDRLWRTLAKESRIVREQQLALGLYQEKT